MSEQEVYDGRIDEVFSGDDLIAMLDLKFEGLHKRVRIRLHGVDTPNGMGNPGDSEAGKIRQYVRQLCHKKQVRVTVVTKYVTNWIAIVEVIDGGLLHNVNSDLIQKGYIYNREK